MCTFRVINATFLDLFIFSSNVMLHEIVRLEISMLLVHLNEWEISRSGKVIKRCVYRSVSCELNFLNEPRYVRRFVPGISENI